MENRLSCFFCIFTFCEKKWAVLLFHLQFLWLLNYLCSSSVRGRGVVSCPGLVNSLGRFPAVSLAGLWVTHHSDRGNVWLVETSPSASETSRASFFLSFLLSLFLLSESGLSGWLKLSAAAVPPLESGDSFMSQMSNGSPRTSSGTAPLHTSTTVTDAARSSSVYTPKCHCFLQPVKQPNTRHWALNTGCSGCLFLEK